MEESPGQTVSPDGGAGMGRTTGVDRSADHPDQDLSGRLSKPRTYGDDNVAGPGVVSGAGDIGGVSAAMARGDVPGRSQDEPGHGEPAWAQPSDGGARVVGVPLRLQSAAVGDGLCGPAGQRRSEPNQLRGSVGWISAMGDCDGDGQG